MKTEFIGFLADPTEEARIAEDQEKKRRERRYLFKQRALGVLMVVTGIVAPRITSEGIFAALFFIPVGITLIFSKSKIITDDI